MMSKLKNSIKLKGIKKTNKFYTFIKNKHYICANQLTINTKNYIMKRLTINLKEVEKRDNKINNTLSFTVKNQKEINDHLSAHKDNIKKHQVSNF